MSEVTKILEGLSSDDLSRADELLPLVYRELHQLAAAKIAREKPGQTLQATALVHEAYLRLVGNGDTVSWKGKAHFFAAAAEAMRRILIERARRKATLKLGGGWQRVDLEIGDLSEAEQEFDILALDEALEEFHRIDSLKAELVKLKLFAGLPMDDVAHTLGISRATADRHWNYARGWLGKRLCETEESQTTD